MPRRHNSIAFGAADYPPVVLNGLLLASPTAEALAGAIRECPPNGHGAAPARCKGCGYLTARCGCPGSPRLTQAARPAPAPVPVGCPRCRPDGCPRCGYRPASCTCPGGPRGQR